MRGTGEARVGLGDQGSMRAAWHIDQPRGHCLSAAVSRRDGHRAGTANASPGTELGGEGGLMLSARGRGGGEWDT